MRSPTTARGLLGIFPLGSDLPATNHSYTTRLSDCQHICPYRRYQRPGPGEEARGVGRAAAGARGTTEGEAPEKGIGMGMEQGGRAARQ